MADITSLIQKNKIIAGSVFLTIFVLALYFFRGEKPLEIKYNTAYKAVYACGKELFNYVGSFDQDDYDARSLEDNLLFILNGQKNDLYVYTPLYAGKTQLQISKDGKQIPLMKEAPKGYIEFKTPEGQFIKGVNHDGVWQYNIRIPYLSKEVLNRDGYYYMTINDTAFDGHHDSRINFPPRFLAGEPQERPDFSEYKKEVLIYYPLDIEDQIWEERAGENTLKEAIEVLNLSIVNRIGQLGWISKLGLRGNNPIPRGLLPTCEYAGQQSSNEKILEAVRAVKEAK